MILISGSPNGRSSTQQGEYEEMETWPSQAPLQGGSACAPADLGSEWARDQRSVSGSRAVYLDLTAKRSLRCGPEDGPGIARYDPRRPASRPPLSRAPISGRVPAQLFGKGEAYAQGMINPRHGRKSGILSCDEHGQALPDTHPLRRRGALDRLRIRCRDVIARALKGCGRHGRADGVSRDRRSSSDRIEPGDRRKSDRRTLVGENAPECRASRRIAAGPAPPADWTNAQARR